MLTKSASAEKVEGQPALVDISKRCAVFEQRLGMRRLEARGLIFLASCPLPRASRLIEVAHFSSVALLAVKLNAPVAG